MRARFIVFEDTSNRFRKIKRTGSCPNNMLAIQAQHGEIVIEGRANDAIQKVDMKSGKPVLVDKTQAEIDADKLPAIDPLDMPASITQRELNALIARVQKLEKP